MQRKLTWILSTLALALFAFIYFFERKIPGSAERLAAPKLFAQLSPGEIRALEITFQSGGTVRAEQTNGAWFLTRPVYPAQQSAIETLVTNILNLRRFDRIPQHKVVLEGQKAFGLDPARAAILIETETNSVRLEVGGPAPLTNNIYMRLEGAPEVLLTQADLLYSLPRSTNDWRSEDLLHLSELGLSFDHLEVRSGPRLFQIGKNPTNKLWQITKPIPARGDQVSIAMLLERFGNARVGSFVADGPVDLERYGLQTPPVELTFANGTNDVFTIQFGGTVTNQTNQLYARLLGHSNIVTVSRDLLEYLNQPYKTFHDPHLLTLDTNAIDRINVDSLEKYSLQRQPNGRWLIEAEPPVQVDPGFFREFVGTILSLRILDIAKEVPTDADLQALGLKVPRISFEFYQTLTNSTGSPTNSLMAELAFGNNLPDRVYARRSDETPIYVTELAPLFELPHQAFRLRDRTLWNYATNQVVRLSLISSNQTNSATLSGASWSSDPIINAALQEAIFRMSHLQVVRWTAKGEDAKQQAGIVPGSQMLEIELKTPAGPKVLRVRFGKAALRHNVYATSPEIPDEPLVFEFPGEIYHLLLENLPRAK